MPGLLRAEVIETNPRAAIVIPKLVAEECLLRNLVVGLFAAGVVLIFVKYRLLPPRVSQPLWDYPILVFGSLGACIVAAMVAAYHRARRTVIRTLEWFELSHPTEAGGHPRRARMPDVPAIARVRND